MLGLGLLQCFSQWEQFKTIIHFQSNIPKHFRVMSILAYEEFCRRNTPIQSGQYLLDLKKKMTLID